MTTTDNEAKGWAVKSQVAVDTQIMRGMNAAAVLNVLRTEVRLSVSDLSERTGLSRQAVTRSLGSLEANGLIAFSAPDASEPRSGRPAQLVRFRAEAGSIVAVSVTPRVVTAVVSDLSGFTLGSKELPLRPEAPVESVIDSIDQALGAAGISDEQVWAAAIASPGIIDTELGSVRFIPSLSALEGDVLTSAVSARLGCPVEIDNDLNLATEGELWRGGLDDVHSMVLIEWGERVGAGLVLNGALYRGASNDAGDVGFVPVIRQDSQPHHPRSATLGDFEDWVGSRAIIDAAIAASEKSASGLGERLRGRDDAAGLEIVRAAALGGEEPALAALHLIAQRFAIGLLTIRALIDPQLVLLGGPVARFGDLLLNALQSALSGAVLNPPEIRLSSLGEDAIIHGAIHRAMSHVESTRFAPHSVTDAVAPSARQFTT